MLFPAGLALPQVHLPATLAPWPPHPSNQLWPSGSRHLILLLTFCFPIISWVCNVPPSLPAPVLQPSPPPVLFCHPMSSPEGFSYCQGQGTFRDPDLMTSHTTPGACPQVLPPNGRSCTVKHLASNFLIKHVSSHDIPLKAFH